MIIIGKIILLLAFILLLASLFAITILIEQLLEKEKADDTETESIELDNFYASRAVISLSGGLDSTMLLMDMLARGCEVKAYSFDYGQKHDIELKKVKKNISFLKKKGLPVEHQVINLRDCFSDSASSLKKGGESIPHDRYDSENQKSTVVENRNIIFSAILYGKALAFANKTKENIYISLGVHSNDDSVYPDCRKESVEMSKKLYNISNWGSERVEYIAPYVDINKGQVLESGLKAMKALGFTDKEINTVLSNTHSCYDTDEKGRSCGCCGTCQERRAAFAYNDMNDPIEYSKDESEMPEVIKL